MHFIGSYVTVRDDSTDPPDFIQKFLIRCFFPCVPLIKIPPATPEQVKALLNLSFALAFMDQSAYGNLLRSSIEILLTQQGVPRYATSNGKRRWLRLHERIGKLPLAYRTHNDRLLALKWIGTAASHSDLSVQGLQAAFEILEDLLQKLYGTRERELARLVKRINKRRGL